MHGLVKTIFIHFCGFLCLSCILNSLLVLSTTNVVVCANIAGKVLNQQSMSMSHDSSDRIQCYYQLEECSIMSVHDQQHNDVLVLSSSNTQLRIKNLSQHTGPSTGYWYKRNEIHCAQILIPCWWLTMLSLPSHTLLTMTSHPSAHILNPTLTQYNNVVTSLWQKEHWLFSCSC